MLFSWLYSKSIVMILLLFSVNFTTTQFTSTCFAVCISNASCPHQEKAVPLNNKFTKVIKALKITNNQPVKIRHNVSIFTSNTRLWRALNDLTFRINVISLIEIRWLRLVLDIRYPHIICAIKPWLISKC